MTVYFNRPASLFQAHFKTTDEEPAYTITEHFWTFCDDKSLLIANRDTKHKKNV